VFAQSDLSDQKAMRSTFEQSDGDSDLSRMSILNESVRSGNDQKSTETIEEPFLQKGNI